MRTLVYEAAHSATTELAAFTLDIKKQQKVTIRCLSDRGGTLKTRYVFKDGKVADDQSVTVSAASLSRGGYPNQATLVFDFPTGKINVTFTPADGTTGFTRVEVISAA